MLGEYVRENRAALTLDIARELRELCDKSYKERYDLAVRAVHAIFELGDYAIFRGLVVHGARIAAEKVDLGHSEYY